MSSYSKPMEQLISLYAQHHQGGVSSVIVHPRYMWQLTALPPVSAEGFVSFAQVRVANNRFLPEDFWAAGRRKGRRFVVIHGCYGKDADAIRAAQAVVDDALAQYASCARTSEVDGE